MPFNIYSGYKSRCRATNWRQKCKYARKHNFNTNTSITNPTMSTGLSGAVKYSFVDSVHLQLYFLFMLLLFVILYFNQVRGEKPFPPTYLATKPFFTVNYGGQDPKGAIWRLSSKESASCWGGMWDFDPPAILVYPCSLSWLWAVLVFLTRNIQRATKKWRPPIDSKEPHSFTLLLWVAEDEL